MSVARLRLASRYADLGLSRAALSVLADLQKTADEELAPAVDHALFRIYSATGSFREAREVASQMVASRPGPASRVRLGEAQLALGQHDAARFAFAAALEGAPENAIRARALIGRADVALREDDQAGAGAAAMTALDEIAAVISGAESSVGDLDDDSERGTLVALAERAITIAVAADRGSDVETVLAEIPESGEGAAGVPREFLEAIAWDALGKPDVDVASRLGDAVVKAPAFLPARLRAIEHSLRRRYRNDEARTAAIDQLGTLAEEIEAGTLVVPSALAAAVQLSLASAYEDLPAQHEEAQRAYRAGLALRPGELTAATRLADLAESRGDRETSLESAARALMIDPDNHLAWLAAARASGAPAAVDGESLRRLLEAAAPTSGHSAQSVRRLVAAAIEVARADLLAGMHARGHRVKNLLGILGSRARRSRKLAESGAEGSVVAEKLAELEGELTSLYEEWAKYLRSMHADGPSNEEVDLNSIISEVVRAARSRTHVRVELSCPTRLPALRGDRVLLAEALSNIANNAIDACESGGGMLSISVRLLGGPGSVVEISFADTGPGIASGDLSRVLAPGFTTKESGSGLGLAISERVVRAHRGRLLLDSQEGEGTQITVLLPTEMPGVARAELSEVSR